MLPYNKIFKTAKKVWDTSSSAVSAYHAAELIVGKERMAKIGYHVVKKAGQALAPAIASDPNNRYEVVIADLNAVLAAPPLADLAELPTRPSDKVVYSALLNGEQAIASMVASYRKNAASRRDVELQEPAKAEGADEAAAKSNVLTDATGYLYHKKKTREIQALTDQINKREQAFIKELAADPLSGAMHLGARKVFERLLNDATTAYCSGKRDEKAKDRYVEVRDPLAPKSDVPRKKGEPIGPRIYGYKTFAADPHGVSIYHKAAAAPDDFYMEKLMDNKTPKVKPLGERNSKGKTPLMLTVEAGKFVRMEKVLRQPQVKLLELTSDGDSLFDLALAVGDKKDVLATMQAFLENLTVEQKKELLNLPNGRGQYPLTRAATLTDRGSLALAKLLIKEGATKPADSVLALAGQLGPDQLAEHAQKIGGQVKQQAENIAKEVQARAPEIIKGAKEFFRRFGGGGQGPK